MSSSNRLHPRQGVALIEVAVALLLLALLLVPIWGLAGAIPRHTMRMSDRVQSDYETRMAAADHPAWKWGIRPFEAVWEPGPQLVVRAAGNAGTGPSYFGLWVGGWFEGEWEAEASGGEHGTAVGEGPLWLEQTGAEVVVRARSVDGGWGPPRRTVVPDVSEVPLPSIVEAGVVPEDSGLEVSSDGETMAHAVHLPYSAGSDGVMDEGVQPTPAEPVSPLLVSSDDPGDLYGEAAGVLWTTAMIGGSLVMVVEHGTQRQVWRFEQGRGVDVYF